MRSLVLAVVATLALAGSAAALCTCGDRDGCSSAAACAGKSPGDECGRQRSCKIVVGTGNDLTCCCGCSRGVGPLGCNYGTLGAVDMPADAACGSKALGRLADRVEKAVNTNLERGDAACRDERNALRKANAARGKLNRLRSKIEKAAKRKKIDEACAAASLAYLDAVKADIDDIDAGNAPGGATTTTTTLPTAPSCAASFVAFSDPAEVVFQLGCFAAGADYQGFRITMGGGREVTNYLEPPGFVCTITTQATANDSLSCAGNFNVDTTVMGGRIRTSPAPAANMPASLFVRVGDTYYGPFATTGP